MADLSAPTTTPPSATPTEGPTDPRRRRNLRNIEFVVDSAEVRPQEASVFDQSDDFVDTGLNLEILFEGFMRFISELFADGYDSNEPLNTDTRVCRLPVEDPPPIPTLPEPIHRNFPE